MKKKYNELKKGDIVQYVLGVDPDHTRESVVEYVEEREDRIVVHFEGGMDIARDIGRDSMEFEVKED